MPTPIKDLIDFDTLKDKISNFIDLDLGEEKIEVLFLAAGEICAQYLGDVEFEKLPQAIFLGLVVFVKTLLDREDTNGLTSAKTKDLVESYAKAFSTDAAFLSVRNLWKPFKLDVLL